MQADRRGFTLVELMIVVLIIGILAAIAIPNIVAMQGRAKEGSLKANMHTFQLMAEDQCIQNDAQYVAATAVAGNLPTSFENPFDHSAGSGNAWEACASSSADPMAKSGITSYWTDTLTYNIKGYGKSGTLGILLTSGQ